MVNYEYDNSKTPHHIGHLDSHNLKVECKAPTQSLLQKWLRDVHNIYVRVDSVSINSHYFWIRIFPHYISFGKNVKTYEDALEVGLFEALKLIKLNKD